jgi:hypothetical protein
VIDSRYRAGRWTVGGFGTIVTEANRAVLEKRLRDNTLVTKTGCWEWQRYRLWTGYGRMTVDGRMTNAHRVAYELFIGPIPPGLIVCHRCDNPPCCNPEHLFTGTWQDNTNDAMAKGRTRSRRAT